MPDTFDPYYEWLSITDPERPPNHYRLLGLELFESDTDAIWAASMRHMALVLGHDPGLRCEAARRLFDELEIARSCLLDTQRKRKYDDSLRQHLRNAEAQATLDKSTLLGSSSRVVLGSRREDAESASRGQAADRSPAAAPTGVVSGVNIERLAALVKGRSTGIAAGAAIAVLVLVAAWTAWTNWEPAEVDPIPLLVARLQHEDPHQRLVAARALKELGPAAYPAAAALIERLGSEPDDEVRLAAAEALGNCSATLSVAAPQLRPLLDKEMHPGVRAVLQSLVGEPVQ